MATFTQSTSQSLIGLSAGDTLNLLSLNLVSRGSEFFIQVASSSATISPFESDKINFAGSSISLEAGEYILKSSGPGASWILLSSSSGSGGGGNTTATYVTSDNETGDLPNSRQLLAGTNVTIDSSTPGELTINASGGSGGGLLPGDTKTIQSSINTTYTILSTDSIIIVENDADESVDLTLPPISEMSPGQGILIYGDPNSSTAPDIDVFANGADSGLGITGSQNDFLRMGYQRYANVDYSIPVLFIANPDADALGGYQWITETMLIPADDGVVGMYLAQGTSISFNNNSGGTMLLRAPDNSSQTRNINIRNPISGSGNFQIALVDDAGGTTGHVPVWNAGPGQGGYFSLQAPSGGSGNLSLGYNTASPTGDYLIDADDGIVIYTGSGSTGEHTLTLPASPSVGEIHDIYNQGSSATYILLNGNGNSIEGTSEVQINNYVTQPQRYIFTGSGDWRLLTGYDRLGLGTPVHKLSMLYSGTSVDITPALNATVMHNISIAGMLYSATPDTVYGKILFFANDTPTNGGLPITIWDSGNSVGYLTWNSALGAGDKRAGTATTSGGTVTVATTAVTATCLILLTPQGNSGVFYEDKAARVNGTSFEIVSTLDTDFAWMIIEP